jgi:Sec63 Brl domain
MSAIAQAAEFHDIRLKAGEKSLYKHINKDVCIKFPIQVDVALPAHKVSLLMQAELGGMDFPMGEQFAKHRSQFQQDKAMVFQHVNRLVRCITDCQLTRGDSVSARHALELARSFAARVWDNSPLQLKQLENIGNVAVRKLANAGINSLESLENTETHRIEAAVGRGPPFGIKLLSNLARFPKLRVLVKMTGKEMKPHRCTKIRLKAEIGFLNEHIPVSFSKKSIYACFLAETSDGQIIDFRRIAASRLRNGHEVFMTAELTKPSQYILCHVMCDEIAGTCRSAELKPNLPASLFPTSAEQKEVEKDGIAHGGFQRGNALVVGRKRQRSDDFDDSGLDDGDLLAAESVEIMDIDAFDAELASLPVKEDQSNTKSLESSKKQRREESGGEPAQLKNGKWACNHKCKEKGKCKHFCCKEGLDKPPKPSKKFNSSTEKDHHSIELMLDAVNNGYEAKKYARGPGDQEQPHPLRGANHARSRVQHHEATRPNVSNHGLPVAISNPNVKKMHKYQSVAANATSFESVHTDPVDSDGPNKIGLEDFEDSANRDDLFGVELGRNRPIEADKQDIGDDAWPGIDNNDFDFDDNDALMLEASMVGLDDSLQLKQDSNNRQNEKMDSESNASFSSGTIRESSISRVQRSQIVDIFDGVDGLSDSGPETLETLDPVMSWSSGGANAAEGCLNPSSNDEPVTSPSKKLFFQSPERTQLALTSASTEDTSSPRRDGASISTPTINVRAPLEDIVNPRPANTLSNMLKQQAKADAIDHENEDYGPRTKGKEREEERSQRLRNDDGIDPSFYAEFRDYVEFI